MKNIYSAIFVIALLFVLSACSAITVRSSSLSEGYMPNEMIIDKLELGMSRQEVYQRLGSPSRTDEQTASYFYRSLSTQEVEHLQLEFDELQKLSSVQRL